MALAPKKQFVAEMQAEMEQAQGVLFVDFFKLTVAEVDRFRGSLRDHAVKYRVVKNTLMGRVLEGKSYERARDCFKGTPTGMVWGSEDPVTPAKLAFAFAKECDHFKIKGGIVDGQAIGQAEAQALSKLPSREELQGQVVSLAKSPGGKLQGALAGPAGKVVGAIDALVKRLEEAS